jgi:hypothetical protein
MRVSEMSSQPFETRLMITEKKNREPLRFELFLISVISVNQR